MWVCTMKFIAITDVHLRTKTPTRRKDADYLLTQLAELEYVFAQAQALGIQYILCSGDLGDQPNWMPRTQILFMELVKRYDLHIICTVGQHDVYGHNIQSVRDTTTLGALEQAGIVTILHGGNSWDGEGCRVYGYGFGEPETEDLLKGRLVSRDDGFSIALVHAQVGSKETMGWDAIENQNIKGVKLALFGDIHPGFEPYKFPSGTVATSVGALARSSISDVGRTPQYAVIDIQPDNKWGMQMMPIPTLEDNELFDLESVSKPVDQDMTKEFRESYVRAQEIAEETPEDLLMRVGTELGYDKNIVRLAIDNLEKE